MNKFWSYIERFCSFNFSLISLCPCVHPSYRSKALFLFFPCFHTGMTYWYFQRYIPSSIDSWNILDSDSTNTSLSLKSRLLSMPSSPVAKFLLNLSKALKTLSLVNLTLNNASLGSPLTEVQKNSFVLFTFYFLLVL